MRDPARELAGTLKSVRRGGQVVLAARRHGRRPRGKVLAAVVVVDAQEEVLHAGVLRGGAVR